MRRKFAPVLLATLTASLTLAPCGALQAQATQKSSPAAKPAPLAKLVEQVNIPYETFTLPNGLTTIVHTDRKAPVVGVTIYYRVGSKHEPRGRTGFAHLFEHLMFGGSENVENFDIPLEAAGSTSTNGSTWFDRTNYIETVPTGALDLALFMESDRMGHLLGAVTQDKLDKQRSVVQNEKRQGDNQPYGLVDYAVNEGLLPVGHAYRHSTIGSMADLDAASLTDVRKWFTDNYGPNNVILVLSGDIDAATARPKVEKWFGDIPRGPDVAKVTAEPITLAAPVLREMADQVPVTRIYRTWSGPALTHADAVPLAIGMHVLGGLASSRLDNALVRDEQLAVRVSAAAQQFEQLSFLQVEMDVKPGVDRAQAEKRLDEIIADLVKNGPTQDELQRAATQSVSAQIGALEVVGGFSGKGATLAEGLLYAGDPANYKRELERMAALIPAEVQQAMQRWLDRPALRLAVVPGERTEDGAAMGGWGDEGTTPAPSPDAKAPVPDIARSAPREYPPVAEVGELTFPGIERAKLDNGITVTLARRTAIPKVSLHLSFDAGFAADGPAAAGTQSLMMNLLEEGTTTRTAVQIAEEQERLGASIATGSDMDSSSVTLTALTANLAPSLELMADMVRNPAFKPEDVARVKDQRLADIAQEKASPFGLATRALRPILYGTAHPYGTVGGLGDESVIAALTPEAISAEHRRWLRPDLASITVVGDITMDKLLPQLNATFGHWPGVRSMPPRKDLTIATPAPQRRLVVIDRPNSPQSVLVMGRLLPLTGKQQEQEALDLANEVIGDGFLSRLNLDLREDKGWSYGVGSQIMRNKGPEALLVYTQVQSDKTADSIRLILDNMAAFPGARPVEDTEFQRVTDGNIRGMPNRYQTNGQVLGALVSNSELGRPDDYQVKLPEIYRAVTKESIDAAARQYLQPSDLAIIVVGDRKVIDQQLAGLDMPVEYVDTDNNVSEVE
ncbi:insulinase family protein [Altererythrobacter sp. CC-YST694]|uniref:M16 family metallopeptidase n=1 Tax=Altererythrobacter sp. CC-YST694 TaxID=2755038 RepID=UPI001D01C512|nr:pitrilysin family protein [Altererythrobacter sp. CC-YST694]MCB5426228.1 insulinase family protein [Altererythrobacter sp. CC-YST694]